MAYQKKFTPIPRVVITEPDWPKIIGEIIGAHCSASALARAVDMGRDKLYSIREGRTEPTHYQGEMLVGIHRAIQGGVQT